MGFTKRGSWGRSRAFRVNHGKYYRPTSVTVLGVNSRLGGGGGRRSAHRKPTKSEILATHWRLRPGIYRVTLHIDAKDTINIEVDGGQLTYARFQKLIEARKTLNWEQGSRALRGFVRAWDILDDKGKTLPLTPKGIETVGLDMVIGLAVEAANALSIPATPLSSVMTHSDSHKPVKVTVTPIQLPAGSSQSVTAPRSVAAPSGMVRKSQSTAYVLWLVTGLIGGHRYYLGRPGTGFLMTITLGGFGLWWLLDAFLIPSMVQGT